MKMKIIGHRGAAGLALENTLSSLKAGIRAGVYAMEVDVRLTKDGQAVLCHDPDLSRVSDNNSRVSDLTLEQLKAIKLLNNESVPLLSEALEITGSTPLIIELKEEHCVRPVLRILNDFPNTKVTIVSFIYREIALLKELRPDVTAYVASRTNPFEILYIAKAVGANGLSLNFWILNPLVYLMARHGKLDVMVYTINNHFFAQFMHFFYPKVMICTDNPQFFIRRRVTRKFNARNP